MIDRRIFRGGAAGVLLATVLCLNASADTADCDSALASCQSECSSAPDQDSCGKSCSAGQESCVAQDSANACNTFYYHCIGACPRDEEHFDPCYGACTSALVDCGDATSSRTRTRDFNACEEGRLACDAGCMTAKLHNADGQEIGAADFKTGCTAACVKAVAPCQADGSSSRCDRLYDQCKDACPQSSDTDSAQQCDEICGSGRFSCQKILG